MRVELETVDKAARRSYSVILGLGYVGLPLAQQAVASGVTIVGLDQSERVVGLLNEGRSHIDDVSDADVAAMRERGFCATTDPSVIADATEVIICVPTPLSEDGGPDLGAVRSAGRAIATQLKPQTLVVLESTTYPGTTEEVLGPILEEWVGSGRRSRFRAGLQPGTDRSGKYPVRGAEHTEGGRRSHRGVHANGQARSTPASSTSSWRPAARVRPRWRSCSRTPIAMSTSRWSTRWCSSATSWTSTCGT